MPSKMIRKPKNNQANAGFNFQPGFMSMDEPDAGEQKIAFFPLSLDEDVKEAETHAPTDQCEVSHTKDTAEENFKLVCHNKEGERFEILISEQAARQCELLKTMIDGDKDSKEIPVPNVDIDTMHKVLVFLNYTVENKPAEIEKPLKSADIEHIVAPWFSSFIDIPQEDIFNLILAANYLDNKDLLDLGCAKIATQIKGKTPEQIRKIFNIQNDFTPEEEEAVRAENKWAEES